MQSVTNDYDLGQVVRLCHDRFHPEMARRQSLISVHFACVFEEPRGLWKWSAGICEGIFPFNAIRQHGQKTRRSNTLNVSAYNLFVASRAGFRTGYI